MVIAKIILNQCLPLRQRQEVQEMLRGKQRT